MTKLGHPLRASRRPRFEKGDEPIRIVDLFAGCGGLTLGLAQAAEAENRGIEIALAVDFEPLAAEVYRTNFEFAERVEVDSVESFFDGDVGDARTFAEQRTATEAGQIDILVGGPPCQGHSNLNNHTRRVDSKNALYLRMVRAAEVFRPRLLLIENVPAVVRDRHDGIGVVDRAVEYLGGLGYAVQHQVIALAGLGVAQTRKRHILLASAPGEPSPDAILMDLARADEPRDLRWAIEDLAEIEPLKAIDRRSQPTATNLERMRYLIDNDEYDLPNRLRPRCQQGEHSYKSMYGRLKWDGPAQTITSGFGSIGQGRYMHPDQPRALTAHEAARIQGFPDYFDFSNCPTRGALATMIGNAVPPQLGAAVLRTFLQLQNSSTTHEAEGVAQSA